LTLVLRQIDQARHATKALLRENGITSIKLELVALHCMQTMRSISSRLSMHERECIDVEFINEVIGCSFNASMRHCLNEEDDALRLLRAICIARDYLSEQAMK
jgi:hypothetical protein